MQRPNRLVTFTDLAELAPGLPTEAVTRTTTLKSPEEFQKQTESVTRRRTNASVVGIILLEKERVALVKRSGTNSGWALPSGSLKPYGLLRSHETFEHGLHREIRQELGVHLDPLSIGISEAEERKFVNIEDGRSQNIYVVTFMARAACGESIRQTRAATREDLTVGSAPLRSTPPLAFNDNAKIINALPQLAVDF